MDYVSIQGEKILIRAVVSEYDDERCWASSVGVDGASPGMDELVDIPVQAESPICKSVSATSEQRVESVAGCVSITLKLVMNPMFWLSSPLQDS